MTTTGPDALTEALAQAVRRTPYIAVEEVDIAQIAEHLTALVAAHVEAAYQRGLTDMQNHPCTCDYAPGTHDPENPNCRFRVLLDAARAEERERVAAAIEAEVEAKRSTMWQTERPGLSLAARIARAGQEPTP